MELKGFVPSGTQKRKLMKYCKVDVFQQEHKCIVICGCERIREGSDSLNYYKRAGIEAIYRKNDRVLYNYHIHCNTVNIGIVLR